MKTHILDPSMELNIISDVILSCDCSLKSIIVQDRAPTSGLRNSASKPPKPLPSGWDTTTPGMEGSDPQP